MSRIKIDLPLEFAFETELSIRICDLNYGGHLGNDALLSLIQEARVRFIQSLGGVDEGTLFGAALIMTDAAIVYKSEGHQGDRLKIQMGIGDLSRTSFDLLYKVENLTTGKDLAHVKTGMAFFNYESKRLQPAPSEFVACISKKMGLP